MNEVFSLKITCKALNKAGVEVGTLEKTVQCKNPTDLLDDMESLFSLHHTGRE